jgi:hypothetical protein
VLSFPEASVNLPNAMARSLKRSRNRVRTGVVFMAFILHGMIRSNAHLLKIPHLWATGSASPVCPL